jgi:DNA (cytosine-5)-methyltransferase 1
MPQAGTNHTPDPSEVIHFEAVLDHALDEARKVFVPGDNTLPSSSLSSEMTESLKELSRNAQRASAAFTNIVTCLAIKAALPNVDIRYHQTQIQSDTPRPADFNFRGVSERVVYPWLSAHEFQGARSGWQTRTLERPKPYTLTYEENIQYVKEPFLKTFNEIEVLNASPEAALKLLMLLQLQFRETRRIDLAIPKTNDISQIIALFRQHFFRRYEARGASRLPVLAFHSIYSVLVQELARFQNMTLLDLQEHSAADAQTGAIGDIEIADGTGKIFEALEIKHDIEITHEIIEAAKRKIMTSPPDRYYLLTTHQNCDGSPLQDELDQIQARFGCQVIVNGVVPSLRYYLRLLKSPSLVFQYYAEALAKETAIAHEHRLAWNEIVLG